MAKTPRIHKARKPRTRKPKTAKPIAAQAAKKPSHRVPPKPASWNCARGTCRLCGEAVLNDNGSVNRRKHWHTACGELWFLMNNPGEASRVIKQRDNYTCQHCGVHDRFGAFQVDHIKPLFEAQGDPTYWQPGNLTLLCVECHKIKTRSDMIRWRAAQKVDDGTS